MDTRWPKANRNNPCPACGHQRRCHIREDGRAGRCYWPGESRLNGSTIWKEEQEDTTGPFRLWFMDDAEEAPVPAPTRKSSIATSSAATSGQLDRVYSRLLELCPMPATEAEKLAQARGLEPDQVRELRFGRLPRAAECTRLLGQLEQEFGAGLLGNIPGFYKEADGSLAWMARGPGLIIPHFDGESIVALQIRPDGNRKGSKYFWFSSGGKGGAVAQAPYLAGDPKATPGLVVVTEGCFKALAAARRFNTLALGLPGVATLEPAMPLLQAAGAKEVMLAFDADHAELKEGKEGKKIGNGVYAALRSAVEKLRGEGLAVALVLWNRGEGFTPSEVPKGIDDAILAGVELFELRGDQVDEYLQKVGKYLGQLPEEPKKKEDAAEKALAGYRRLKARIEKDFDFFVDNDVVYIAAKNGTAYDLSSQAAGRVLFNALEKAAGGRPPTPEHQRQITESKASEVTVRGPFHPVRRRLGHRDGKHYLDLCRTDGKVVEMTAAGWRIIDNPLGLYWKRRRSAAWALPDPIRGGDVMLLGQVLNAKGPALKFLIAFLVAILRTEFSFPLLVLEGRAGSAKSFAARVLKFMVDPCECDALVGDLPKNKEEVAVSCNAAHLVVFDNVDRIKPEMSDFLCQVATGSAIKKRALYTAGEEAVLTVRNPIILTGIEGIVDRADLASRAALVTVDPVRDEDRREERELWGIAERIRPQVLGGLLDAFCAGLANLDRTPKPKARNIDFARFMLSSENGLPWKTGEATEFLTTSRNELYEQALWKDRVALAVIDFQSRRGTWQGTMADLLQELQPPSAAGEDFWPTTPHKLTRRITQAAPLLEYKGVSVTREAKSKRGPVFRVTSLKDRDTPNDTTLEEVVAAAEGLLFS